MPINESSLMNEIVKARQKIKWDIFYQEYLESIDRLCVILMEDKYW